MVFPFCTPIIWVIHLEQNPQAADIEPTEVPWPSETVLVPGSPTSQGGRCRWTSHGNLWKTHGKIGRNTTNFHRFPGNCHGFHWAFRFSMNFWWLLSDFWRRHRLRTHQNMLLSKPNTSQLMKFGKYQYWIVLGHLGCGQDLHLL